MMSGDTGTNNDFGVFVAHDLWEIQREIVKDRLPLSLTFRLGFLRFIQSHVRRRLVTSASGWQKDDGGQKIVTAKGGDKFGRRDFGSQRIHL